MAHTTLDITLPDLTAVRAMVTGASDGIGFEIARRLGRAGAELMLPFRNAEKGAAALRRLRDELPELRVRALRLDLASLDSVAALGSELRSEGHPIGILIGNAGLMTPPARRETADGFELQFGTNHLGHVALIAELLPLLIAGRARVTAQISVAAARGGVNWDDLQWTRSYDGMRAYRQSKIAYGLFGLELNRRSRAAGWGITSTLSHPGVAPTSLLAARADLERSGDTLGRRLIGAMSRRGILVGTAQSAALSAVYAAASPSARTGELYGPSGPGHLGGAPAAQRMYAPLRDTAAGMRIWDLSQDLVGRRIEA